MVSYGEGGFIGTLAKGGIGDDGIGDRPPSEISVLEESAPGDVAAFQPKKELILLPGVLGCRGSAGPMGMDP